MQLRLDTTWTRAQASLCWSIKLSQHYLSYGSYVNPFKYSSCPSIQHIPRFIYTFCDCCITSELQGAASFLQKVSSPEFIYKKRIKIFHYRPGVAQRVGRGIVLLFHDGGTRRGWVVSSTPRPHFTPRKDPVPIIQEAGWAPGLVWTGGKSRPPRIRSRTVQPVVSCYTDWATRSTKFKYITSQILDIRGLLEKYPTFGREKETGLLGALDT